MPVRPPEFFAAHRFDPEFLTDEDLDDLASFTGMDADACRERIEAYSLEEHADRWRSEAPQTPEEMLAFYGSTELYLWELMQWHASRERGPYWEALSYLAEHFPPDAGYRRVYDFGCGVGTDALFLASNGYDVTLVDVDGPAFRFAKHRFERRGLPARFVASRSPLPEPDGEYDVVVCFDVLEHLPEPLEAARRLVGALRKGGLLVEETSFGYHDSHPCHVEAATAAFAGLRWKIYLLGLGMRHAGPKILLRIGGVPRIVQRSRFLMWKLTGLWVSRVARQS